MKYLIQTLILIFILSSQNLVNGQVEYATIELDEALKNVNAVQQFSDQQGNTILCFQKKKKYQFVLIRSDHSIISQAFELKNQYDFLESIYDDDHFYLFYRDKRNDYVYLYKTDKQSLPKHMIKIDTWQEKERHLSDVFHQGDFVTITYSNSPYSLHTYHYTDGPDFEKRSQSFDNHKKEKFFLGRIVTEEEFISVRLTLNPLTFHFYRYYGEEGFEKRSVQIRPLYDEAGTKGKHAALQLEFLSPDRNLNAFIDGDEIYLDLNHLIHINSLQRQYKRPLPGVLKLNWQSGISKVLMTKNRSNWKYDNQSTSLHNNLFFNLTVNREKLDLSIYDIKTQGLLKRYSYTKDEDIKLIQGEANFSSTSTIYLDLFSSLYIPIDIKDGKRKSINNKKLLKTLSGEELYLDVFSDDSVIELQVSGANYKDVFIEKTEVANFAGYLAKDNLEIIEDIEDLNDPRWRVVDEYIKDLKNAKKNLEQYIVYESGDFLYLVYTLKKSNQANIIQF